MRPLTTWTGNAVALQVIEVNYASTVQHCVHEVYYTATLSVIELLLHVHFSYSSKEAYRSKNSHVPL